MELELVCVRHGTTKWNKEKRYLGHTDIGILPESLAELMPVKKVLEERTFRKIYCSDLKRCRETLDWIYPSSTGSVVFDRCLREMDFGEWEGLTYDQLRNSEVYRKWLDNPQSVTPPGGESWVHFQGRLTDFINSLTAWAQDESKDNRVLVVTHGGVIRQLAAMTISGSAFWDFWAEPGSLFTLKLALEGGKWIGYL